MFTARRQTNSSGTFISIPFDWISAVIAPSNGICTILEQKKRKCETLAKRKIKQKKLFR